VVNDEVRRIAELVKSNGLLVADKHHNDRLHIGCAVVYGCDLLVSLNFKDLANIKTNKGVRAITNLSWYGNIEIVPPAMILGGN
jgi:predicted nucleic acid-binding protein